MGPGRATSRCPDRPRVTLQLAFRATMAARAPGLVTSRFRTLRVAEDHGPLRGIAQSVVGYFPVQCCATLGGAGGRLLSGRQHGALLYQPPVLWFSYAGWNWGRPHAVSHDCFGLQNRVRMCHGYAKSHWRSCPHHLDTLTRPHPKRRRKRRCDPQWRGHLPWSYRHLFEQHTCTATSLDKNLTGVWP